MCGDMVLVRRGEWLKPWSTRNNHTHKVSQKSVWQIKDSKGATKSENEGEGEGAGQCIVTIHCVVHQGHVTTQGGRGQPHATLPVRQQNSEQDERESTRISYLSLTIPLNVYDSESFSTANWSSKFLISLI